MRHTVLLDPDMDGDGYTVTVPALPGCITEGRTIDEALANAREAIACHVAGLLASGDEVPREAPPLIPLVAEVEFETPAPALAG
ncbi:MAG: type II toxin-antitoxin system HicB family antitoxin [Candidatus Binatia bacterium]